MAIQYVDKNADAVSTIAGTYNISGSNNTLSITIDGGSPQTITLTSGATRSAAQVVADINAALTGATAYTINTGPRIGKIRIRTTSVLGSGSTIAFGAPANDAKATLGFTAGPYAGYSRGHTSWTQITGTKQELIDKIETELLAVGWTTISGSGTTNLLMQSALSPPQQNLQFRLRLKDNSANCVTASIESVDGTLVQTNSTTGGAHLLPAAGKNWLFTCNKYQACIRVAGSTVARGMLFAALPALPSFLEGVLTQAAYIHGSAPTDSSTSNRASFRNTMSTSHQNGSVNNHAQITNSALAENIDNAFNAGTGQITTMPHYLGGVVANSGRRWHDETVTIMDALIGWYSVASAKIVYRGYIWDALTWADAASAPVDTTAVIDGVNWIVLTDNPTGDTANGAGGSIFLRIP